MHFGEPKRLTQIEAGFSSIAWSRHGDRIAYAYEKKRRCGIVLISRDGSNSVPIAGWDNKIDDSYWDLQWSPGDDFLIAGIGEEDGEFHDICRIETATGAQTRLTQSRRAQRPMLTPDGHFVVFRERGNLLRVATQGGEITPVTHTQLINGGVITDYPRYSPDGNKVAFASSPPPHEEHSMFQLFVANADGSAPEPIADLPDCIANLIWHPGGERIFFTVHADLPVSLGRTLWKYRTSIYSMASDGTDLRRVEFADSVHHLGNFSPDGRYLAYMTSGQERFREGWRNWDIRVLDLQNGNDSLIVTDNDIYDGSPLFSPDGATLLFASERAAKNPNASERPVMGLNDLYAVEYLP